MKINATKIVQVEAKTLKIQCKVRDEFTAALLDANGETLTDYEGYVPGFMPGEHYGDYLFLDIDVDTGVITNWKKPTPKQIEDFIKGYDK